MVYDGHMTNLSREAAAYDRWLTTEPDYSEEPDGSDPGDDGRCPCGGDHAEDAHEAEAALDEDADAYFDRED